MPLLDEFVELRKAATRFAMSFCMYVCPIVGSNETPRLPLDGFS